MPTYRTAPYRLVLALGTVAAGVTTQVQTQIDGSFDLDLLTQAAYIYNTATFLVGSLTLPVGTPLQIGPSLVYPAAGAAANGYPNLNATTITIRTNDEEQQNVPVPTGLIFGDSAAAPYVLPEAVRVRGKQTIFATFTNNTSISLAGFLVWECRKIVTIG